jgi:hypothetical protein
VGTDIAGAIKKRMGVKIYNFVGHSKILLCKKMAAIAGRPSSESIIAHSGGKVNANRMNSYRKRRRGIKNTLEEATGIGKYGIVPWCRRFPYQWEDSGKTGQRNLL